MGKILRLTMVLIFWLGIIAAEPGHAAQVQAAPELKIIRYQVENYFVPVVDGIKDYHLQSSINKALWGAISSYHRPSHYEQLTGNFTVPFYNENLLVVHFRGSSYHQRAAHPVYLDFGVHVDMTTGRVYKLADLFLPGVDYESRIKQLCRDHQQDYRLHYEGMWDGWTFETFAATWRKGWSDDQFLLDDDAVRLYTMPSQVSGYISGYRVPFSALDDIINKDGELWKALQGTKVENVVVEREKLDYDDFVVRDYNIRPGDNARSALSGLGEANAQEQTAEGISYDYGDVVVVVADNQVVGIHTGNKRVLTKRWVHPGQPVRLVLERYGEAYVSSGDGYDYYEYYYGTDDRKGVLRFAVKQGEDTVEKISWLLMRD